MGIGLGIILLVIGLILVLDVVDIEGGIPGVNIETETLGLILLIVGGLAVVLSLIISAQRRRTTHVEERHEV